MMQAPDSNNVHMFIISSLASPMNKYHHHTNNIITLPLVHTHRSKPHTLSSSPRTQHPHALYIIYYDTRRAMQL